jgi:CDP-diacylglycerol--glycerol-3-phosphate 3-phosphatidyltransferase
MPYVLNNDATRETVSKVIDPVAEAMAAKKVNANVITVIGGLGASISAVATFPFGRFGLGTALVALFVVLDILDGAIARSRGTTSSWGAFLDSTLDRVADGALSASVAVYLLRHAHATPVAPLWAIVAGVTVVVTGALVPYVKARAEAGGIVVSGGLMERAERLILMAAGTTCAAFGWFPGLYGAFALLAVLGTITVFQRVNLVRKGVRAA